jgi:hypothetical protein
MCRARRAVCVGGVVYYARIRMDEVIIRAQVEIEDVVECREGKAEGVGVQEAKCVQRAGTGIVVVAALCMG